MKEVQLHLFIYIYEIIAKYQGYKKAVPANYSQYLYVAKSGVCF